MNEKKLDPLHADHMRKIGQLQINKSTKNGKCHHTSGFKPETWITEVNTRLEAAGNPAANMAAAAAALAVDVGLMVANDDAPQLASRACCNDV